MSIEKQAEALIQAVSDFLNGINGAVAAASIPKAAAAPVAAAGPGPGPQDARGRVRPPGSTASPEKKDLKALQAAGKAKAGEVLTALGKEKLKELLSRFGVAKYSELLHEADYTRLIEMADGMLSGKAGTDGGDDLLGGEAASGPEYTAEDVKVLFLKVNNHKELGKDVTRQLLAELGVARLPELKKEKFGEAVALLEKTLKSADEAPGGAYDDLRL
jgi:hypothetical protein